MNNLEEQALLHAKKTLPDESCGLVIDKDGTKEYFPCKNIAIEGANSFTIDPEDWAKAEETGTVLHICHSHPNQDLTPSEEDIKNCDHIGLSWFIFDPINDEISELKPKEHKPMLSRDKFVNRERTEDEINRFLPNMCALICECHIVEDNGLGLFFDSEIKELRESNLIDIPQT